MTSRKISTKRADDSTRYSPKSSREVNYPDTRQQEMKRRFGILQSRQSNLERELLVIKTCLISLDQQMQSHAAYKQLSLHRQKNSPP